MHKSNRIYVAILLTTILTLSVSALAVIPAHAQVDSPPTITLTPSSGPVLTPITITGANFKTGATVDLSWYGYIVTVPGITGKLGYYPILTPITVGAGGSFTATFITPYDFAAVTHFVNATQNGIGTGIVNATFSIMPSLQLSPSPANYTEGQEVTLHVYGAPIDTQPEVLKFTYDNTQWGYDTSHVTTEGPVDTGGFTGGDIGGNITITFIATGVVGWHYIRAYEGPNTTAAWLSCTIGGQVMFYIHGPSDDTQLILNQLNHQNAELCRLQNTLAKIAGLLNFLVQRWGTLFH